MEMINRLRVGTYQDLNIFIKPVIVKGMSGYSSFPQYPNSYDVSTESDGILISGDYIPDARYTNILGNVAVHEVGHWLGLLHTWHGEVSIAPNGETPPSPPFPQPENIAYPFIHHTSPSFV